MNLSLFMSNVTEKVKPVALVCPSHQLQDILIACGLVGIIFMFLFYAYAKNAEKYGEPEVRIDVALALFNILFLIVTLLLVAYIFIGFRG